MNRPEKSIVEQDKILLNGPIASLEFLFSRPNYVKPEFLPSHFNAVIGLVITLAKTLPDY
jgi:hypothetical protein